MAKGVAFDATDIRCATTNAACPSGSGSDYTGKLLATASLRMTDKYNGASQSEDGTVADTALQMPVTCVPTGDATAGADCALNTTLDALIPGIVREGNRAIWQLGQVEVKDAGRNGTGFAPGSSDSPTEAIKSARAIYKSLSFSAWLRRSARGASPS